MERKSDAGKKLILQPTNKDRTDRVAQSQIVFDEFIANANAVDSVILMLDSGEEQLTLNAFYHLDKFAMNYIGNYRELYDRKILPALYRHMESPHRFTRRFAMKILSQMFVVPEAKAELLEHNLCFEVAMRTYTEINDSLLVEYAAIILNELLANPVRLQAILGNSIFFTMVNGRVPYNTDPDVLHQSLLLMYNVAKDPDGLERLCNCQEEIPFSYLLTATKSEYTKIQLCALDVLQQLCECKHPSIASRFKESMFFEDIFFILENNLRTDLHSKAIDLLRAAVKKPPVAENFYKNVYLDRYMSFVNATKTHKLEALAVLVELANYANARPILHENEFSTILVDFLKSKQMPNISTGIGLMAQYKPALDHFLKNNVIQLLFDLLKDATIPIDIQKEIASALANIFKLSSLACRTAIDYDGMSVIAELLARSTTTNDSTTDLKMQLIRMLISLATHQPELRAEILTVGIAQNLLFSLKENVACAQFTIEMLKCIGLYMPNGNLEAQLIDSTDFHSILSKSLSADSPILLRKAATDFILSLQKSPKLTDEFIDRKLLDCLLNDTDAMVNCPNWNEAIDTILANNLPMKFAIRGQLDMTDRTDNDFYATKKIWTHYRRLREILVNDCSARRPIILCNFDNLPPPTAEVRGNDQIITVNRKSEAKSAAGKSVQINEPTTTLSYNRHPFDANLPCYLQIIKEAFQIAKLPEKLVRPADLKRGIEILAEFVARKLCTKSFPVMPPLCQDENTLMDTISNAFGSGRSSESTIAQCPCPDDYDAIADEHLNRLKEAEYVCNIIPMGSIKYGGYFEKSLLFKVLADRVELPCKLVMDPTDNSNVWIEVCILDGCGDDQTPSFTTTTHVVDLMEYPGSLYTIDCQRAKDYRRIDNNN